jgi:hydrogenase-4 component B
LRLSGVLLIWLVALFSAALSAVALREGQVSFFRLDATLPALQLQAGVALFAAPFLALLAMLCAAAGTWSLRRGSPKGALLVACFAATMLLVLVAQSVAMFFLAWEAMSIVSAFLVATHHERRSVRRATVTYLIVAQSGALCVLIALALLAAASGSVSFSAIAAGSSHLPAATRNAAFALAFVGFGSKAGLVPLHFWLPRAHPVAPANASAMLSGVMLKIAIYGLGLVALQLAAPAQLSWGLATMLVGTVSAVAGVLYAIVDHDLKRLLAYHSVENVGIIAIGLGLALTMLALGRPALAALGLAAALFHTINHGLFKGLLFLGAGTIADVEGTVDLERLGGLGANLIWTGPFFLIGCAAISALPPFNGFVSEWMTFQGLIASLPSVPFAVKCALVATIVGLALTSGLAAACFVKVFGIAFLGRARRAGRAPQREPFDASAAGLAMLATLCTLFGVVPVLVTMPLARTVGAVIAAPFPLPTAPILAAVLVAVPVLCAVASYLVARRSSVRFAPTWTCGSPVTPSAQYSATAFSKPIRTIFAFFLVPERRRIVEVGVSSWFPERIIYTTKSRYLVDEVARRLSAVTLSVARRSRRLQSGSLRLYLVYAVVALVVMLVVAQ